MKILLLCNKSPWPLHEGGPIAMYAMICGLLKAGHRVKVLAANTNKYSVDPASIPSSFAESTSIEFATIDLSIRPMDALYNYLTGQSYHVSRFLNKEFEMKLVTILKQEEFDIIQAEMLYTTAYLNIIRKFSKAPVILRAHNIEHLIWQRMAGNCRNPLKRHYFNHLFLTLRNYELNTIRKVDGIVAITGTDAAFFREHCGKVPVVDIPFGIDADNYSTPDFQLPATDLFHIGAMNWPPNEEGIRWFLDKVWPGALKRIPGLTLHLAGRMMPAWLTNLHTKDVVVEGEVPDALEFMRQHAVMVVPLFSGSGIRIKIIEAMTAGKVVISTRIGAEGIQYENGIHLLIADTPEEFIIAIERLASDPKLGKSLGENARMLMETDYNNKELMKRLTGFYQYLIDGPKSASR